MILIPKRNNIGKEWCAYWEDFLTEDELNYLANHDLWNNQKRAEIGESTIDETYRRTNVSWLPQSIENIPLYEKIADVFAEVNKRFFHCNLDGFLEPMQLTKYNEDTQDYYDWHTDMSPDDKYMPRKLSMVLMLSDPKDFEGGELQIKTKRDNDTLDMKKGRAWFFPSYVLHRVTPVTKGIRKTAVLWASGEQWK